MGFHNVPTDPPTLALSPVIPINARALCITAAAGTELAGSSFRAGHVFLALDSSLHPEGLHPARGITPSRFRALRKIRYCSLP